MTYVAMSPQGLSLALLVLLGSPQDVPQAPLSRLMPPPERVAYVAQELRLDPAVRSSIEQDLQSAREVGDPLLQRAQELRSALSDALQEEPFDTVALVQQFEELLDTEHAVKMAQARARLRILGKLSPAQRGQARRLADRMMRVRRDLHRSIEEARRLGRRLRFSGLETAAFRERMRAVERVIRDRDHQLALSLVRAVLKDMRSALGR